MVVAPMLPDRARRPNRPKAARSLTLLSAPRFEADPVVKPAPSAWPRAAGTRAASGVAIGLVRGPSTDAVDGWSVLCGAVQASTSGIRLHVPRALVTQIRILAVESGANVTCRQ